MEEDSDGEGEMCVEDPEHEIDCDCQACESFQARKAAANLVSPAVASRAFDPFDYELAREQLADNAHALFTHGENCKCGVCLLFDVGQCSLKDNQAHTEIGLNSK